MHRPIDGMAHQDIDNHTGVLEPMATSIHLLTVGLRPRTRKGAEIEAGAEPSADRDDERECFNSYL